MLFAEIIIGLFVLGIGLCLLGWFFNAVAATLEIVFSVFQAIHDVLTGKA